jgi:2-amino-4-hydroxy-6-hydroxymethyldihydropteridine diphosphokinase
LYDIDRGHRQSFCGKFTIEAQMEVTAFIALGSNLGQRQAYLDRAVQALRARPGITSVRCSTVIETEPVGGPLDQGKYLNAAAEVKTTLPPEELLRALLEVEQALGRVRTEKDGPRIIDLDLLLFGSLVQKTPTLTVPHPRMHERLFVLEPLAEIAPDVTHPELRRTMEQLRDELRRSAKPQAAASRALVGLRAVVTGSSSGIGRAIALAFAAAGADVVVHARQSLVSAGEVAAEAKQYGVHAEVLPADLRDPERCRTFVASAWDLWDGLDIWVNNAGADTLTGEAAQWSFETKLAELLSTDVIGTVLLSRDVGQRMKAAGQGVILNMGWDQADAGMEGDSGQLFGLSKAAVMAFSKSLALTLAPQVRVNCLAPGWIRTAWGEQASSRWQERVERETPLRRWGLPQDVAAAAVWLASPAAAFITGQVIRINGGAVR